MQVKLDKDQKLFLIYVFESFNRNQAKMFDFLSTHKLDDEWFSQKHTQEQNHRYLLEWKRKNNIFIGEYEFGWESNGQIPTLIRAKTRKA